MREALLVGFVWTNAWHGWKSAVNVLHIATNIPTLCSNGTVIIMKLCDSINVAVTWKYKS